MPFINTHRVGYEVIPEEVFDEIGMAIIGRIETGGSKVVHDRRFKATFGCLPKSCSDLWRLILTSNNENFMVEVDDLNNPGGGREVRIQILCAKPEYKPEHLLWALYFMKIYLLDNHAIVTVNCNEKTFRKWIIIFIDAVASLKWSSGKKGVGFYLFYHKK